MEYWRHQLHRMPPDRFDEWQERAAILEYDAGLNRDEAERLAFLEVCNPPGNGTSAIARAKSQGSATVQSPGHIATCRANVEGE